VPEASPAVFASKPFVYGLNYWVGAGGVGYGGCTNILTGGMGNWAPRPGASQVQRLFTSRETDRTRVSACSPRC
jgi:hypothetical protein